MRTRGMAGLLLAGLVGAATAAVPALAAEGPGTDPATMMDGLGDWNVESVFTVGQSVGGYAPPGVLDGLGAFEHDGGVRVLANHEIGKDAAHPYTLANGTELTGARISYFDFDRDANVLAAGVAFDTIYDRNGDIVTTAAQVNEEGAEGDGLDRFCSGRLVLAGEYGFADDVYFAGEESGQLYGAPHGGSVWALDVDGNALWAVPALGRGSWENVTPVVSDDDPDTVELLLGDDYGGEPFTDEAPGAPLYYYRGTKQAGGDFLQRNGLADGQLYVWAADDADVRSPEEFNGTGSTQAGSWVAIEVSDAGRTDQPYTADTYDFVGGTFPYGWDAANYRDGYLLRQIAVHQPVEFAIDGDPMTFVGKGAFMLSRPEDLNENPADPSQAVIASTGRPSIFPADTFGTTYVIDLSWDDGGDEPGPATMTILYDGDDEQQTEGLRSPDNVTWAADGMIYVQEDKAIATEDFGSQETSIWQLDPDTGEAVRIAQMDRSAVPEGLVDGNAGVVGDWESSGIVPVTDLFETDGDPLLLATVQAHDVSDDGDAPTVYGENLVETAQLILVHEDTGTVARVAGDDRIATAIEVSRASFGDDDAAAVVLARADVFADALAGTPLATTVDAPLLLTPSDRLDTRVLDEIARALGDSGTVHVLGGTAAVSTEVEQALTAAGYRVERIGGDDRFETAVAIADAIGTPDAVLLATGLDFADPLSAGAAAATMDGVIVLTAGEGTVPTTDQYVADHPDAALYAVGGPAARAYGAATPVFGADRYATAVAVQQQLIGRTSVVGLARGDVFADALTGGAHIAGLGGGILLALPGVMPQATRDFACDRAGSFDTGYAYGGPAALSDDVVGAFEAAIDNCQG